MMNWINKKRNKKGFTLVELVVVIAILGILAAVAVPRFANQTTKAQKSADAASIRTVESAISMAIAEGELIYDTTKTGDAVLVPKVTGTDNQTLTEQVIGVIVPKYLDKTPISQEDSNKALTISIGNKKEIIVKFGS